jgi:hypothetical protein
VRSRHAALLAAAFVLVVVLAACSSDSSTTSSSSTTTTPTGPPVINSFSVPAAADCSSSPGRVEVKWTTTNVIEVALFVDGAQAASGPYADGNDALQVTCDGKQHLVRLDASSRVTRTSRTERTQTTGTGGGTPPAKCADSQGIGKGAVIAYGSHMGSRSAQATVFSIRCATATGSIPGEYAIVTLATQAASGRFRVLMVQPPASADQGAAAIGFDTEEGAPPGFTYTDCGLDPAPLASLGLPTLHPSGGADTKNCPIDG